MKAICNSILIFIFSLFVTSQIVIAEQVANSDELNNDSPNIENFADNDKSQAKKNSEGDIFGDEQTFPFVAGLGKNAAH